MNAIVVLIVLVSALVASVPFIIWFTLSTASELSGTNTSVEEVVGELRKMNKEFETINRQLAGVINCLVGSNAEHVTPSYLKRRHRKRGV